MLRHLTRKVVSPLSQWHALHGAQSNLRRTSIVQRSHYLQKQGEGGRGEILGSRSLSSRGFQKTRSSRDLGLYLLSVVIGMVGLTYASVPLYRIFCNATGFAGTVRSGETVEDKIKERKENPQDNIEKEAQKREITVWFEGTVVDGMEWSFLPTQRSIKVHPGQSALAFYKATNNSKNPVTGISTYNVTPNQTGYYFNKIQCFCFENQRLRAGESVDMPVFFYIDPEFAVDRKMKGITDITLSYTFFKVDDDELGDTDEVNGVVAIGE